MNPAANADIQDVAFEALLALAKPTEKALDRVQTRVDDEIKLVGPLREDLHVVQRAALSGYLRFALAVRELGAEYGRVPGARRYSTSSQEEQNIYLWTYNDRFMLRVKREPVDQVDPGTQRLFAEMPRADRPVQVFLTWDVSESGQITGPAFACVEEPKWTISLARLLAHTVTRPETLKTPSRSPIVKSTRPDAAEDEEQDDRPVDNG